MSVVRNGSVQCYAITAILVESIQIKATLFFRLFLICLGLQSQAPLTEQDQENDTTSIKFATVGVAKTRN